MRIAYLSGPTDAEAIFRDLRSGAKPDYFGTNYMRQFLKLADELEAETLIATWQDAPEKDVTHDRYRFLNVPPARGTGARYHWSQVRQQFRLYREFASFKPDLVLLTGNQNYWWVYALLKRAGARFIASFHSVIWPKFATPKLHQRILLALNKAFALPLLDAAVMTSEDIRLQLEQALGGAARQLPMFTHLPSYEEAQFRNIGPVEDAQMSPFRTMFMGRIEEDKGVFDLLEVASRLEQKRPGHYAFDICGSGSDLPRLKQSVSERSLDRIITCHGYCEPDRIRAIMSIARAVIVPTRKDFDAGFEMTCSEAVLSGRPLITSAVSPALHYLRPASVEVHPEDVGGYCDAIERLSDDVDFFNLKAQACAPLRDQFFDPMKSWDVAIRNAFKAVGLPEHY